MYSVGEMATCPVQILDGDVVTEHAWKYHPIFIKEET